MKLLLFYLILNSYESFRTRQGKPPETVLSKMKIKLQLIRKPDKIVFPLSHCLQRTVLCWRF